MKLKSHKNVLLIVLMLAGLSLIAFYLLKPLAKPPEILLPQNFSSVFPEGWKVVKKPLPYEIVIGNNLKRDERCFIHIFVVRQERDYPFKQWLGTALTNKVFLEKGKETIYKNYQAFVGSYEFFAETFDEPANHTRTLLKKNGVLADVDLTYKNNSNCIQTFDQLLDSVTF